jgi:hypothetical protein
MSDEPRTIRTGGDHPRHGTALEDQASPPEPGDIPASAVPPGVGREPGDVHPSRPGPSGSIGPDTIAEDTGPADIATRPSQPEAPGA